MVHLYVCVHYFDDLKSASITSLFKVTTDAAIVHLVQLVIGNISQGKYIELFYLCGQMTICIGMKLIM